MLKLVGDFGFDTKELANVVEGSLWHETLFTIQFECLFLSASVISEQ